MTTTLNKISRSKGYARGSKTIEDLYQAQVDTANDDDAAIAAAEAVGPPLGYRLDGVNAKHINRNPFWFEVRVTYIDEAGSSGGTDPLTRPSVLSASWEEWTAPYFRDADNKPVVNTAWDRFDPLPQRRFGSLVLQITKNYSDFAAVLYDSIKYTTNGEQATIKGTVYTTNTLLFLPPTVQEVFEQVGSTTHHYYAVTFRLAADADEHVDVLDNRGYQQILDDGTIDRIADKKGIPTPTPWPLVSTGSGIGKAKAAGQPADPLTFKPYESASWGINFN